MDIDLLPSPARSRERDSLRRRTENLTGDNTTRAITVAPRHPARTGFLNAAGEGSLLGAVVPWEGLQAFLAKPGADESSDGPLQPMSSITELTVLTGDRYRVEGEAKHVEQVILDAARGSIMQLAWLVDAETGEDFAVNPGCVVILRADGSRASSSEPRDGAQ